jgi:hypothetical protein
MSFDEFEKKYTSKGYKLNSYVNDENTNGIDLYKSHNGNLNQIVLYNKFFNQKNHVTYRIINDYKLFNKFKKELLKSNFILENSLIQDEPGGNSGNNKIQISYYSNHESGYEISIYVLPPNQSRDFPVFEINLKGKINYSIKYLQIPYNEKDSIPLIISEDDYEYIKESKFLKSWKEFIEKDKEIGTQEFLNKTKGLEDVSSFIRSRLSVILMYIKMDIIKIKGEGKFEEGILNVLRNNNNGIMVNFSFYSKKENQKFNYKITYTYFFDSNEGRWSDDIDISELDLEEELKLHKG